MTIKSIRAIQPGTEYSPKDWRTWVGQILVIIETDDGLTGYGVGGGGKAGLASVVRVQRGRRVGVQRER